MSAARVLPAVQARAMGDRRRRPLEGVAFYRKHTEGMLRRYMRASMEMGRTPSLLGNNIFRGKASSYRLRTFEDCIIFIFDVEKCLARLDAEAKELIARVALQEYTHEEAAALTSQSVRSVSRKYAESLDKLTRIFVQMKLLTVFDSEN